MNIVARFGYFLRDLGSAIAEAAGAKGAPTAEKPANPINPRIRLANLPVFVPAATFRNREAAEEFRALLREKGIDSEIGGDGGRHYLVGVAPEHDEVALEYLADLYGVPEGLPAEVRCPSCDLRVIEELGLNSFKWRCLRCGQLLP